ncbi:patatin [Helicobacter didelphidarum]|uniref:Patatin n=1 Tax=Helicobacter didelphidarum TaxID=2040648 RepID=A0A3D8IQY4_9HELI|nr:patatin-like phospholipase family protein [Helicobacter didelphidarum]RDU67523.1 patatin [Helicobacter didelphidarum]
MQNTTKKLKKAIVLGGGGSKGSYQIGAWKALRELQIDYDIVTGTSIGSFNGVLMVQDDFERALDLWMGIDIDKVIINGLNLRTDFNYYRDHSDKLLPFLKSYADNKGMDITPLKRLLSEYIHEDKFFKSHINYGLVSVKFPSMKPCQKAKDTIQHDSLKDWILASCSCFPAFPIYKIGDDGYIDGGYYDNLPINFAFMLGAEQIIAIALNPNPHEYSNHPLVRCIQPKESLGSMLDFDNATISENITLGYLDTMKSFGKIRGNNFSFYDLDMKQYNDAFIRTLSKILHDEATTHYEASSFELLQKIVNISNNTPIHNRILELLTSSLKLPDGFINTLSLLPRTTYLENFVLALIESQMYYFEFDVLQIHTIPNVLQDIWQKSRDFLHNQNITSLSNDITDREFLSVILCYFMESL